MNARAIHRPCRALLAAVLVSQSWGCGAGGDTREADAAADPGGEPDAVDAASDDDAPPVPGALSWSAPENISASATFSDLKCNWGNALAATADGTVHGVWREVEAVVDGVVQGRVAHRSLSEGAWSDVQDLSSTAPGTGHPKVAASGSHVYVIWHVYHPDPAEDDEIMLRVSGADGAPGTFDAARAILADAVLTSRNLLGELSTTPSIAATGDRVHVVWADERSVPECGGEVSEVYQLSSADRGGTWSSPSRVSSADCRSSWTPSVAAAGDVAFVAWTDTRDEALDCGLEAAACHEEEYARRLTSGGTVPDPAELRLTHDDPASMVESWAPSVAAWDEIVQVAWFDRSGGDDFEVYVAGSRDGGSSFDLPGRRLSDHASGCFSARPTVTGEGAVVHVVWFEICGDAEATVLHSWSPDLGATWSPVSDVTSGTGVFAIQPYVVTVGATVHVMWTDSGEIWHASSI